MGRSREPGSVSTSVTGAHATGHHLNEAAERGEPARDVPLEGLVWIEKEDQAKQGMARTGDMRDAAAAPDRPHPAGRPDQGGRQSH